MIVQPFFFASAIRAPENEPFGASGLQVQRLEFRPRRPVVAQMVNRYTRRREGERLKWFGEHFVQVFDGGETGGDVRQEMLAGMFRNEHLDVMNRWLVEVGSFRRGKERGRRSGFLRVRDHGVNQILLQFDQFGDASITMPDSPRPGIDLSVRI